MHLIERYATSCGIKIDEPFIMESYFPIIFDKYVLIHAGGGADGNFPAKIYDYFNEVIALLRPILKEENIELIQIGGQKDPALHSIIDLRGASNIHQTAYLIKRAALLIGNDSVPAHLAGGLGCPTIALYSPSSVPNHGVWFGEPKDKILIESHRNGHKPSFTAYEDPKTINYIKPEEIVKSALKLLKINKEIKRETLYIGPKYNEFVLEAIMDAPIPPDFIPQTIPKARMDLFFNEDILAQNLSLRKYEIVTDKPINIEILKTYKESIAYISYKIKEDYSIEFIENLLFNGIKYYLYSYLPEDKLNMIKLDFLDYGIIDKKERIIKEKLENHEKITKNTIYKTMKFLLSNNKIFLNEIDWQNNQSVESLQDNTKKINLSPRFFKDAESYYIYNE